MRPSARIASFTQFGSRPKQLLTSVALGALLILFPALSLGQEERAAEKAARDKARQEEAAKQQASPEAVKTDE